MILLEKAVTLLVLPTGLVWLGLMAGALWAWRRKQKGLGLCLMLLWALHTAAGNVSLAKTLLGWLERDYTQVRTLESGPFDVVVVLGGGTATGPTELAQMDAAGDRVAMAARLHHAGCAPRLIATGERIAARGTRNPGEEAAEILAGLGVPAESIIEMSGRNTREEMRALAAWSGEQTEPPRMGLITSAWHMRRAMRLSQTEGLELAPLPADFRGGRGRWGLLSIIPCADGVVTNSLAVKEILATMVGK